MVLIACTRHRDEKPYPSRIDVDSMIRSSIRMPYITRWVLTACTRHRDEKPYRSCIEVDSMIRSAIRVTLSSGYGTHSLHSSSRREAVPILCRGRLHGPFYVNLSKSCKGSFLVSRLHFIASTLPMHFSRGGRVGEILHGGPAGGARRSCILHLV